MSRFRWGGPLFLLVLAVSARAETPKHCLEVEFTINHWRFFDQWPTAEQMKPLIDRVSDSLLEALRLKIPFFDFAPRDGCEASKGTLTFNVEPPAATSDAAVISISLAAQDLLKAPKKVSWRAYKSVHDVEWDIESQDYYFQEAFLCRSPWTACAQPCACTCGLDCGPYRTLIEGQLSRLAIAQGGVFLNDPNWGVGWRLPFREDSYCIGLGSRLLIENQIGQSGPSGTHEGTIGWQLPAPPGQDDFSECEASPPTHRLQSAAAIAVKRIFVEELQLSPLCVDGASSGDNSP